MLDAASDDELLRTDALLAELKVEDLELADDSVLDELELGELELDVLDAIDDELVVGVTGGVGVPASLPPPQALKLKARAADSTS